MSGKTQRKNSCFSGGENRKYVSFLFYSKMQKKFGKSQFPPLFLVVFLLHSLPFGPLAMGPHPGLLHDGEGCPEGLRGKGTPPGASRPRSAHPPECRARGNPSGMRSREGGKAMDPPQIGRDLGWSAPGGYGRLGTRDSPYSSRTVGCIRTGAERCGENSSYAPHTGQSGGVDHTTQIYSAKRHNEEDFRPASFVPLPTKHFFFYPSEI